MLIRAIEGDGKALQRWRSLHEVATTSAFEAPIYPSGANRRPSALGVHKHGGIAKAKRAGALEGQFGECVFVLCLSMFDILALRFPEPLVVDVLDNVIYRHVP